MDKLKLFVDFDGTIANSNKAICDLYNKQYADHDGFVPADYTKVMDWGYADQCPLLEEGQLTKYFGSRDLFRILEPNADACEMINELKNMFQIIIVTIGVQKNIHHKAKWIEKNFPDLECIYIFNGHDCNMDKSIVNMANGIFIDDNVANLDSSNAPMKLIYGTETHYNKGEYIRLNDWKEAYVFLTMANKFLTDIDITSEEENEYWKEIRSTFSEVLQETGNILPKAKG